MVGSATVFVSKEEEGRGGEGGGGAAAEAFRKEKQQKLRQLGGSSEISCASASLRVCATPPKPTHTCTHTSVAIGRLFCAQIRVPPLFGAFSPFVGFPAPSCVCVSFLCSSPLTLCSPAPRRLRFVALVRLRFSGLRSRVRLRVRPQLRIRLRRRGRQQQRRSGCPCRWPGPCPGLWHGRRSGGGSAHPHVRRRSPAGQ